MLRPDSLPFLFLLSLSECKDVNKVAYCPLVLEISVLQQSLLPPDVLQNLPGPLEGARPSERALLDVRGLGVGNQARC